MALPVTVFSGAGIKGYSPPFISSGGDVYAAVKVASSRLDIYKATDPTSSFAIVDDAGSPAGAVVALSVTQKGDVLYLATWTGSSYRYHEFSMSADTWSVIDEQIDAVDNDPTFSWISIAVRSTGVPVVAYAGDTDQVMGGKKERADVNVRTGGTWDGPIALDAAGDFHYGNPNVVKGPLTDDMHIVWQQTGNTADPPTAWLATQAKTLDSVNALSNQDNLVFIHTGGAMLGNANAVSYDDGTTQHIMCQGVDSNNERSTIRAKEGGHDDTDDIDLIARALPTSHEAYVNGEVGIITITELSDDLHVLFSGGASAASDQDLFYTKSTDDGVTWDTPTEEIDAITVNYISANIYVRGADTVMAYLYDDGGTQKYNEKVLIAGGVAPFLPYFPQRPDVLLRM